MAYDQPAPSRAVTDQLSSRRPTAVDLFCGIGGMSLGFEQAGFDVVCAVDFDPLLAAVHKFNHPRTRTVCADVAALKGRARDALGLQGVALDLVFGGPPCQGFSSIGKRQVEDSRNDLVASFISVATELGPRYIVMENVEGLLQPTMKSHLERAKTLLTAADYVFAEPRKMDASEFGVPQRRRRVFLLAWKATETKPVWPVETHGKDGSGRAPFVTVRDAIGDIGQAARKTKAAYAGGLSRTAAIGFAAPRRGVPKGLSGLQGTRHTPETQRRFETTEQGKEEPISRYSKLAWNGLCHTMRAGTGPDHGSFMSARPIHPSEPRVITVREAERLTQLQELESLISLSNEYDIVRVTLNANVETLIPEGKALPAGFATVRDWRVATYKSQLNQFPARPEPDEMIRERFPAVLLRSVKSAAQRGLRGHRDRVLRPLASFSYSDGNHTMLSCTMIILPEDSADAFMREPALVAWPFIATDWNAVHPIDVPDLSTKEKLHIDHLLMSNSDEEIAASLGFDFGEDGSASKHKIAQYRQHYRFYPHFMRVGT